MGNAANATKSRVAEPSSAVAPASSKLGNRLGPPKEISFSDLVPVKRSSAADTYDDRDRRRTPPHTDSAEGDDASPPAPRLVHLAAAGQYQPERGGRSSSSSEQREKSSSSHSAFERLDTANVAASSARHVMAKVSTVMLF